jgi:hypothetical protein
MTNPKTITTNKTAKHLKKASQRRRGDKTADPINTTRYVQGSLLDYLTPQQKGGDHA